MFVTVATERERERESIETIGRQLTIGVRPPGLSLSHRGQSLAAIGLDGASRWSVRRACRFLHFHGKHPVSCSCRITAHTVDGRSLPVNALRPKRRHRPLLLLSPSSFPTCLPDGNPLPGRAPGIGRQLISPRRTIIFGDRVGCRGNGSTRTRMGRRYSSTQSALPFIGRFNFGG